MPLLVASLLLPLTAGCTSSASTSPSSVPKAPTARSSGGDEAEQRSADTAGERPADRIPVTDATTAGVCSGYPEALKKSLGTLTEVSTSLVRQRVGASLRDADCAWTLSTDPRQTYFGYVNTEIDEIRDGVVSSGFELNSDTPGIDPGTATTSEDLRVVIFNGEPAEYVNIKNGSLITGLNDGTPTDDVLLVYTAPPS